LREMKMVVAYVDHNVFEPIREELLALGFLSLTVMEASGSVPEATFTASYRGAAMEQHLRPKVRIECVVGPAHVATVVDTVLARGGERTFVVVLPVEEAYPTATVLDDEVAAQAVPPQ
jgi:nitrogen regulatory protein PII